MKESRFCPQVQVFLFLFLACLSCICNTFPRPSHQPFPTQQPSSKNERVEISERRKMHGIPPDALLLGL